MVVESPPTKTVKVPASITGEKCSIEQCEVLWAKIEVHAARLTGRQVDFAKAAQLADRASDAGDVVAQVQLDVFHHRRAARYW